jgi:ribosome recycling factor
MTVEIEGGRMSPNQIVDDAKRKFSGAVEHFGDELKRLRTGRAHPSMLDGVTVEAYGTPMPLNQVATVSAPESQLLQISPFDPNNLQAIASAIRDNPSLGMNPSDDGRVVRVPVPPLNEERRREIVKQLGGKQEDAMIALRNIRREAFDAVDQAKKDKTIGEDDAKRLEKQVDDAMNEARGAIESAAKAKETEIMTV